MIEISDMSTMEQVLSILFVISVLVTIVSAVMVFTNESEEIQGKPLLREIMGGLDVFVTSRYLNETGKVWRIPFLIGIAYIGFWVLYFFVFPN